MSNQTATAVLKLIPYVKSISLSQNPDPDIVSKIKSKCGEHHITYDHLIRQAKLSDESAARVRKWLS